MTEAKRQAWAERFIFLTEKHWAAMDERGLPYLKIARRAGEDAVAYGLRLQAALRRPFQHQQDTRRAQP